MVDETLLFVAKSCVGCWLMLFDALVAWNVSLVAWNVSFVAWSLAWLAVGDLCAWFDACLSGGADWVGCLVVDNLMCLDGDEFALILSQLLVGAAEPSLNGGNLLIGDKKLVLPAPLPKLLERLFWMNGEICVFIGDSSKSTDRIVELMMVLRSSTVVDPCDVSSFLARLVPLVLGKQLSTLLPILPLGFLGGTTCR